MMKLAFCAIVLLMSIAFSEAQKGCPPIVFPTIYHTESCRTVTFFIHENDNVCKWYDRCIQNVKQHDAEGCPVNACNKKFIPDNCRRDIFYIYKGHLICKLCPLDKCIKAG